MVASMAAATVAGVSGTAVAVKGRSCKTAELSAADIVACACGLAILAIDAGLLDAMAVADVVIWMAGVTRLTYLVAVANLSLGS